MTRSLTWAVFAVALAAAGCGRKQEAPHVGRAPLSTEQVAVWGIQKARKLGEAACTLAPSQSAVFGYLAAATGGAAGGAAAVAANLGLTPVRHSSGSYIFTGSEGYVARSLGVAGIGPILVKVAVVIATAAVVLELVCVNTNHPELVARLDAAATDFLWPECPGGRDHGERGFSPAWPATAASAAGCRP